MNALPVLEPVKAIAKCGICGAPIFPHTWECRGAIKVADCPLNGEDWRRMKEALAQRNAYQIGDKP